MLSVTSGGPDSQPPIGADSRRRQSEPAAPPVSHERFPTKEVALIPKRHTERARALFLLAAFLSFLLSVVIFFLDDETRGIFVAAWVPSILALGTLVLPPREGPRR